MTTPRFRRTITHAGEERTIIDELLLFAGNLGFPADRSDDVRTAALEACINATENTDSAGAPPVITAACTTKELSVEVRNKGDQFFVERTRPDLAGKIRNNARARGWGLYLMRRLADEVTVERSRGFNVVRMVFRAISTTGSKNRG